MNLSAIKVRDRAAGEQKATTEVAAKSVAHIHGGTLFRPMPAPLQAALAAKAAGKPAAPAKAAQAPAAVSANDVTTVLKTMADGFAKLAAAVKGPAPVQKAAPAPAPVVPAAPAQRSTGNPPSVPMLTETQRRKEAEAKAQARRAAEKVAADRELVTKGTARVLAFRALDVSLSDNALLVLNHVVTAWEAADRRAIPVSFSAAGDALKMSFAAVRDAVTELTDKRALIRSVDSAGIARFMPGLGITGARQ